METTALANSGSLTALLKAPANRTWFEKAVMNVPMNTKGHDRPIYGMLLPKIPGTTNHKVVESLYRNAGEFYGDCTVIFKKDKIVNGTSLTLGDSLDYKTWLRGTPLRNPEFCGSPSSDAVEALYEAGKNKSIDVSSVFERSLAFEEDAYFEVQIHDIQNHTIDNIERVIINKYNPELAKMLTDKGIPYDYIDDIF